VREARLALFGFDGVIGSIVIGNESALKTGAKDIESHLAGAGALDVEEAEVGIASKPDVSAMAVDAPVGFIGVDDISRAHLVAQLLVNGFGSTGGSMIKSHGRSGHESEAEELGEDLAHIAIGEPQFVPQEDGGGFGGRADLAVTQLSLRSLENRAAAVGTEGGVMPVSGDDGLGLKDDVFLNLFLCFTGGMQAGGGAMRANGGSRDVDNAVHMVREASVPGRVAIGSPAFTLLGGIGRQWTIGFEMRSMLGFETGPQLGVLLFQTLVIAPKRSVFLRNTSHVMAVAIRVRMGIGNELVGPSGGNTTQVGTGVPVWALKAGRSFLIAAHCI